MEKITEPEIIKLFLETMRILTAAFRRCGKCEMRFRMPAANLAIPTHLCLMSYPPLLISHIRT